LTPLRRSHLGIHAGFGRIGRLVLRASLCRKDVKCVAVSDSLRTPCTAVSGTRALSVLSLNAPCLVVFVNEPGNGLPAADQ
jgi:hypothetical protein